MPRRNVTWLLGMLIFTLFCWTIVQGGFAGNAASRGPLPLVKGLGGDQQQDYELFNLFIDVYQHVLDNNVHELKPEQRRKFFERSIEGGLQSLDEHSNYLNEKEFAQFRKSNRGSFGGIGVTIVVPRETKRLTVVSPIVGTPAYKAGIKPGDELLKIDGKSTEGMNSDDAVEKITGKPGTPVKITIRHRGSTRQIDLTLVRSQIEVDSVYGDLRDADQKWDFMFDKEARIGYIRISSFGQKTADELHKALEQLEAQNVTGLVLDLRFNPGGLLESAAEISDMFLKPGQKIVSIAGRLRSETYEAKPGKKFLDPENQHPIVILVNEDSASASEIVSAALQDNGRAVVMGERSYGKGSVQNMIELESGKSAMKLTTAKYLRPSGKNIHRFPDSKETDDWGVRPDIEFKQTRKEEFDYWLTRRDRDIIRTEPTKAERAEQVAAFCFPLGSLTAWGQPFQGVMTAAQLHTAQQMLPQAPLKFHDPVLDSAIKYLRERVAPPSTRHG